MLHPKNIVKNMLFCPTLFLVIFTAFRIIKEK